MNPYKIRPELADGLYTKEELLHHLSIYHEELVVQNEELARANHTLQQLQLAYRRLFMDAPMPFATLDENQCILQTNVAFDKLFGAGPWRGKKLATCIAPKGQDNFYLLLKNASLVPETLSDTLLVNGYDGERIVKISINAVIESADREINGHYRCSFHDFTEEYRQKKQMEFLSFHDTLTGLYNRSFFEAELSRLGVPRHLPMGIIVADVNGLKLVNDAFGHAEGDKLLIKTAEAIKKTCRQDDIVARLGGDEFAILLPNTSADDVAHLMRRLNHASQVLGIGDIVLSTAFGSSIWELPDQLPGDLLRLAETRMYKEKLLMHTNYRAHLIDGIQRALYSKHPVEETHAHNVVNYAQILTSHLNLDQSEKDLVLKAAKLHDIGKIAIDYALLEQVDPLSTKDMDDIRKHAEIGYRILMYATGDQELATVILSHHECFDGSGYPRGLAGDAIPLASRILTLCDAFDAMLSHRPYREAFDKKEAINRLKEASGTQFDPKLVKLFIRNLRDL